MELREHQRQALDAISAALTSGGRGQVVMACGGGKTLVAVRAATALVGAGGTVLVLLPSLGLLAQTVRAWRADAGVPLTVLAVCSGQAAERDSDSPTGETLAELEAELGLETTTRPDRIAAFLTVPHRTGDGLRVLFGTYHSSPRIAEAFAAHRDGVLAPLDLVVCDEAHRTAGDREAAFAVVLDDARIPAARRLFLTATPKVHTGAERDQDLVGMDDEQVYGPRLHTLSFAQAIAQGLLQDYRLVVVGVTGREAHQLVLDNSELDLAELGAGRLPAATAAAQIALAQAAATFGLRRMLAFHNRVAQSRAFHRSLARTVAALPADRRPVAALTSLHLDGAMPGKQRAAALQRLRDTGPREWTVVNNVRVLAEGIDVPALDGVAFIAPRGSQIDITQAVGRALRISPDRAAPSVILVPVYLAEGESGEAVLEDSAFRHVWQIVRALRDHDDRLDTALGVLRRRLGGYGEGGEPAPVLPEQIQVCFPGEVGARFLTAFTTRVIEHGSDSYEYGYGALQAYVAAHGDARPPVDYRTEAGYRLGVWVGQVRTARRRGQLRPGRARDLEQLPGWTWDPEEARWEAGYEALLEFVAAHGHARVPQRHRNPGGYLVGRWVDKQRAYGTSGHHVMTRERRERLEALPGWLWVPSQERGWPQGLAELRAYAGRHGSVAGISSGLVTKDGYQLGRWLHACRTRHRRGELKQAQIRELEALPGWRWRVQEDLWPAAIRALREWSQHDGQIPIPHSYVTKDGFDLGAWAVRARQRFVDGRLPLAKAAELAAYPGWTWSLPTGHRWRQLLTHTEAFLRDQGHARIPVSHTTADGYLLGRNILVVRSRHTAGTLPASLRAELDAIPGWSWSEPVDYRDDDHWHRHLQALHDHARTHGTADLPEDLITPDGLMLGAWSADQRREHRTGRLHPARAQALEALPCWDWTRGTKSWHTRQHHQARARELGYPDITALLAASTHLTHRQIGTQMRVSDATVAKWRTTTAGR
ncbi:Helicase associated domain protein [Streptacidiphilus sp. MAP12-20]|uniref:DEAD/DEAH box helicase n=1 Tax=Streptacidiphilus sp. MAP12-20 TaxID=3156299 RepID=UPI003512DFE0